VIQTGSKLNNLSRNVKEINIWYQSEVRALESHALAVLLLGRSVTGLLFKPRSVDIMWPRGFKLGAPCPPTRATWPEMAPRRTWLPARQEGRRPCLLPAAVTSDTYLFITSSSVSNYIILFFKFIPFVTYLDTHYI
jgi:hypothetical protein